MKLTYSSLIEHPARRLLWPVLVVLLCLVAPRVVAQGQIDQRLNLQFNQSGRMLDRNPSLYGGSGNYVRPRTPLMTGNPYATGLMGGGMSMRSYSPIPSASSFRASLGSATLYNFRRDSVGIGNVNSPSGQGLYRQPYYDASTTASTIGMLRGLDTPASGYNRSVGSDYRLDTSSRAPLRDLSSQIVGLRPPPQVETYSPAVQSSIFGVGNVVTPPRLITPRVGETEVPWERRSLVEGQPPVARPGLLDSSNMPGLRSGEASLSTPLDVVLRGEAGVRTGLLGPGIGTNQRESPPWAASLDGQDVRPGLIVPSRSDGMGRQLNQPARVQIADASVMPGYDAFTDIRLALETSRAPGAEWWQEMQTALREQKQLAADLSEEAVSDPEEYLQRVLDTPIATFTGSGQSGMNNELLKAETLMEIGNYFEAAEHYERARIADPTGSNPLPLIGKGHALLAAGEYRSSANLLLRGLERYPDLSRFTFDLKSLMGSGEIIDIRRSKIMRQLDQYETPELRFLLGYLEYHTGMRESGLENLRRAAREAPAGGFIAQYPELLEQRGAPTTPVPAPTGQEPASHKPAEPESEVLRVPPLSGE